MFTEEHMAQFLIYLLSQNLMLFIIIKTFSLSPEIMSFENGILVCMEQTSVAGLEMRSKVIGTKLGVKCDLKRKRNLEFCTYGERI